MAGCWKKMGLKVPPNLNHSRILWFPRVQPRVQIHFYPISRKGKISPKFCLIILFCITWVAFKPFLHRRTEMRQCFNVATLTTGTHILKQQRCAQALFTWLFQGLMQTEKLINMYCYGKEYNPNLHWFISKPSETSNVKAKQIFTWQTLGEPSTEASR